MPKRVVRENTFGGKRLSIDRELVDLAAVAIRDGDVRTDVSLEWHSARDAQRRDAFGARRLNISQIAPDELFDQLHDACSPGRARDDVGAFLVRRDRIRHSDAEPARGE